MPLLGNLIPLKKSREKKASAPRAEAKYVRDGK